MQIKPWRKEALSLTRPEKMAQLNFLPLGNVRNEKGTQAYDSVWHPRCAQYT